ncbi:MAG: YtxH domain-containing protein [Candidatus Acidiferrum sp.]|jgi:gas vesicle protein
MQNRHQSTELLNEPYDQPDGCTRTEEPVSNRGSELASLLVGFGVGIGLAILFAPQSGDETREWLSASAEDTYRQVRRRGRRLVFEAQDLLDRGEHSMSRALRTSKNVLESVAAKLE